MNAVNKDHSFCAQFLYPDNFKMKISDEELQKIAQKSFSTHHSRFGSLAHRASQFCLIPARKSLHLISYGFQSRPGADKEKNPGFQTRPFGLLRGLAGFIGLAMSSAFILLTTPIHLVAPEYLQKDNKKMNRKNLEEPSGTWYVGPFAKPRGFTGQCLKKHLEKDKKKYGYKTEKNQSIQAEESISWGTARWSESQSANTARFDYILIPKREKQLLDGKVEIRRVLVPEGAQSSPTDHLPVDGKIWLKK